MFFLSINTQTNTSHESPPRKVVAPDRHAASSEPIRTTLDCSFPQTKNEKHHLCKKQEHTHNNVSKIKNKNKKS